MSSLKTKKTYANASNVVSLLARKEVNGDYRTALSASEFTNDAEARHQMALLMFSHTPVEHRLYKAMHEQTTGAKMRAGVFSARRLMMLTNLNGYSSIRRGLAGLQSKLSIELCNVTSDCSRHQTGASFYVFDPAEIFARRQSAGLAAYPKEIQPYKDNRAFCHALEQLINRHELSRREAEIALCCAEGLTNAQISERLYISAETAKCHLRHVFIKCGVSRRTQLISQLLSQNNLDWKAKR